MTAVRPRPVLALRRLVLSAHPLLLGAALGSTQLALLFLLVAPQGVCDTTSPARLAALLVLSLATALGLWKAAAAESARSFHLWRGFVLSSLVLSCLLVVVGAELVRQVC